MTPPFVSIVIPTRNGGETIRAVLDAIARQQVPWPFEVIAVDSGSTDGTLEHLRCRVDRLVEIEPEAFDHGLTRNLGAEQGSGPLIVLLVQDAIPASDTWLSELVAPLLADDTVAGSFARQRPRPDASAITRFYDSRRAAREDVERRAALADGEFEALAPTERLERCEFDNVCSCIRRSVWRQHPFRPTPMAEDLEWAREVLLAGYSIVYAPGALVVHSHDRSVRYELARTYILHRRLYDLFRLRTIPSVGALARSVASSFALHVRCHREASAAGEGSSLLKAIALAVAWPCGQYLGGLSAARGWSAVSTRNV